MSQKKVEERLKAEQREKELVSKIIRECEERIEEDKETIIVMKAMRDGKDSLTELKKYLENGII